MMQYLTDCAIAPTEPLKTFFCNCKINCQDELNRTCDWKIGSFEILNYKLVGYRARQPL